MARGAGSNKFGKIGKINYCEKPIFTSDLSVCVGFMSSLRGESGCYWRWIGILWFVQKSHYSKIRTSKFGFAESILSDINPVGPRWVQVSAEFPIKNHQTRINLYSKKLIIRHIVLYPRVQYKSYSPGRYAPRLERLTRAFGARARCSRRKGVAYETNAP